MSEQPGGRIRPGSWSPTAPGVVVVYAAAVLQGLTMVSFPALGAVLKHSIALDDAGYASIFLPQIAFAIIGAVSGGSLARRIGLRALLSLSLVCFALSQGLLALSVWGPPGLGYAVILAATAFLGLGTGLFGAPVNTYPALFFPNNIHGSVVAAHTAIGIGLAGGPLLTGQAVAAGFWIAYPIAVSLVCIAAALVTQAAALPEEAPILEAAEGDDPDDGREPIGDPLFWVFVAIALLYAFAEGTFANWAVIFLTEARGVPEEAAALALSVFWGSLVAGRLVVSAIVARVPPRLIWQTLPVLMALAFLALPLAASPAGGVVVFALAGLACSAFFPLTITLAAEVYPRVVSWVSSMLIAALMVGIGTGTVLIGTLREALAFDDLYRLSVLYPLTMLALALVVVRRRRPVARRPA